MASRITLNDRQQELYLFKSRAVVAGALCIAAVMLLMLRLLYLQVIHHQVFSTLSLNNRLRLMAVAPTRGLIYDRNGVVLAENRPSYRLEITPEEVDDLDATLAALAEVLVVRPSDIERFRESLKRKRQFEGVPLRFNLNDEEVALFSVNRHRFPGVDIAARLSRHYPLAEITAHVLGYVGRIDERDLTRLDERNYRATSHIGKVGVEKQYETELHGNVGYQQVEVNVEGRVLRVLEEQVATPGNDLHLNLDVRLQQAAWEALGDNAGSVIALEPNTGAVLAMVSAPAYDPHLFVDGISTLDFKALQQAITRPLFNRALTGQYPPGSTTKPIVGLAAIERGTQFSQTIHCKGSYKLPGDDRRYRDWKKEGHGHVDLLQAIAQSCDVFFYDLAFQMGIDAMADYLDLFGLGRLTGIDLPGEKRGLLPTSAWKRKRYGLPWFPGETLSAGIGQGYMLMTPLQLAYATAALATNGKAYKPQMLASVERPGQSYSEIQPQLQGSIPINNAENWAYIHRAMEEVMHGKKGTARASAAGAAYRFAGKTGTAQVISIAQDEEYDEEKIAKQHRDHALFIAFAPAEDPKIAISVLVENGGSGSSVAAPLARKVLDRFFEQGPQ